MESGERRHKRTTVRAWLTDTLAPIAVHKITRIDELLPWHYAQTGA